MRWSTSSPSVTGSTAAPDAEPSAAAIADALFGTVPAGRALLGCCDGEPVGLAAYSFLWPAAGVTRSLYLKELFVRAAFRRHGIGGCSCGSWHVVAEEHRCSRIEWTADTDNPDAQRFYAVARGRAARDEDLLPGLIPQESQEQGERWPVRAAAADDGVRAQEHVGSAQRQHLHAVARRAVLGEQPDAEPGDDHVLEQVQAVGAVRAPWA